MTKWDLAVDLYRKMTDKEWPITSFTKEEQELISFYCAYELAAIHKDVLSKELVANAC